MKGGELIYHQEEIFPSDNWVMSLALDDQSLIIVKNFKFCEDNSTTSSIKIDKASRNKYFEYAMSALSNISMSSLKLLLIKLISIPKKLSILI